MFSKDGDFYHIKDSFFEKVQDGYLMSNKENGNYRPHFFAIRDASNADIIWMVPVSSQYEKYKAIYDKQMQRYGICTKIVLGKCAGKDAAFLIQNAFPTTVNYFDHVHTVQGKPLRLHTTTGKTIVACLNRNLELHRHGIRIFFPDINKIYQLMLDELE